jgi:excisionase family DNA binding protein
MTNASKPVDKLMSPDELSSFLSISKSTIYRLVETRKIPFFKINGSLRFSRDDISGYLSNNRFEPFN